MEYYDNYLQHHGVKGQKWGVRRYQNYDGTRKTHSSDRDNTKKGLNDKQKKILKTIAIASVVAAGTVATGYCLKKYGDMNADKVLKSGTNLQHMSRITNEVLDKPFYASYLKRDNKVYAKNDLFGAKWTKQMNLQSGKDLKIAGKKNAENTYKEWLSTDDQARKRFGNQSYFSFNRNLGSPDIYDKEYFGRFYDLLKSKGYDAIHDVNDQFQTGTTAPLIVFGSLKNIKVTDIKDVH